MLRHANKKLIDALQHQSKKIWHTSNLFRISEQEELAKNYVKAFRRKSLLCNSGAEAIEGLIKIVRRYHHYLEL